ncbi:hypothetical protein PENANT_c038G10637 [Penicillium antarcticum]|uniref:Inhibitor I9 domain-containing protein n=1 Tax=Penicillium antarcticum TaxID=416450 RepID=A0A1V6PTA2_9EURO|nr:uncharacterized protein N7508_002101 [Penicillium antarcticum]KAJ5317593.1 hypothetical protein N7508_002101 [Penicillium antarcticum]OQD80171.1 hypothetical protein PENANT_c038G10637 [Penicillium antarcticum]
MPNYVIYPKRKATEEQVQKVRQDILDKGGRIGQEDSLTGGICITFDYDEDIIKPFYKHPLIARVERNSEFATV